LVGGVKESSDVNGLKVEVPGNEGGDVNVGFRLIQK
jgi:hypothetical protein